MIDYGMDGWILKPIVFDRLRAILSGILILVRGKSGYTKKGRAGRKGVGLELRMRRRSPKRRPRAVVVKARVKVRAIVVKVMRRIRTRGEKLKRKRNRPLSDD